MNPKVLLLAAALTAPAQDPFAGSPRGNAPLTESKTMLEDMETMRLVLGRKLNMVATDSTASQNHWVYDQAGTPQTAYPVAGNQPAQSYGYTLSTLAGVSAQSGRLHASAIEALYLPRAGVIYSVTMPPVKGDPRGGKEAAPKAEPVTDWDRARNALEGKAAPSSSTTARRQPPLAEVLLKALADNGKHFRDLRDDESISIVVTFRKSTDYVSVGQGNRFSFGDYYTAQTAPAGQNVGGQALFGSIGQTATGGGGSTGAPVGTSAAGSTDSDAVAELHVKRGNYAEAIKMYSEAIKHKGGEANKLSGDPANAAALSAAMQSLRSAYAKLAQAQLAAGKFDEAKATLEAARAADANMAAPRPNVSPKPPSLPGRLTVSASKRDLVAAGTGKLTLEELAKVATVHYSEPGK